MPSSRLTVARPVRTDAMSRRTRSMAPSMRVLIWANMPFKSLKSISGFLRWQLPNPTPNSQDYCLGFGIWKLGVSVAHRGPDGFTHDHAADVAGFAQVEHDNRQLVVHAERDRR